MTTTNDLIHLPTPGAGLFPLCAASGSFIAIDHDPNEATCPRCLKLIPLLVDSLDD
jgi:hypothetical protein